jgi:hypothetical protein
VNLLAPEDQVGWALLASGNQDVANVEPGFDEQWDGKIELDHDVVPNAERSMGSWKADYDR